MQIEVGQVWTWARPDGRMREMIVQRFTNGIPRRVYGVHPQTGKMLQVLESTLLKGLAGARLVRVIEGYTLNPRDKETSALHARRFYGKGNGA